MIKPKAVMNWSGGKDSAAALQKVLEGGEFDVKYLLTSVNSHWQRISMHGVRRELLKRQAEAIGIELIEILLPEMPSMEVYEAELNQTLDHLVEDGVTHSIFGDIFLEDLREYREKQLERIGLLGVFPLWKRPTADLIQEFLDLGFKAIIVCVDGKKLDKSFCGRVIDRSFINDLPGNVDVCGENGEFHTFVFEAPYFSEPIGFTVGEIVYRKYPAATESGIANEFYFCDLIPA
jgi:uncharacterized protein (TIGR00290 family)